MSKPDDSVRQPHYSTEAHNDLGASVDARSRIMSPERLCLDIMALERLLALRQSEAGGTIQDETALELFAWARRTLTEMQANASAQADVLMQVSTTYPGHVSRDSFGGRALKP